MTRRQAIAYVASLGLRLRYAPEFAEYQVIVHGNPNATYYTNDLEDALETALCMSKAGN